MSRVKPTITVAIPSFNKEKYIDRCIRSILGNSEFINEIIVVDNASADRSFDLAKKYEPVIKCYRNDTNLGMSGNFNRCVDLCKSDWLLIFHADDEMLSGAMEKYVKFIQDFPSVGIIHADSFTEVEGGARKREFSDGSKQKIWKAGTEALSCPYGACSTVLVKKNAYERLGYFIDSSLSSDAEMWARVASKYDVGYLNEPTAVFHVNPTSTGVESLTKRSLKDIRADWDLLTRRIAEAQSTNELREEYLVNAFKAAPASYWAVIKANLRAGNILKVFQTVLLVVFVYRGFVPLFKFSWSALIKKLNIK